MHQHPGLFPDLSVAENIYLGHMHRDRFGGIDNAAMLAGARKVLATVGLNVSAETRLGTLRTSEQQLVEIARTVARRARADHGRAHGGPIAARGRAAVYCRCRSPAAWGGDDVRRPPHGRDLPHRRPHSGAGDGRLIGVKPKADSMPPPSA
jgi:hypothetical protein